MRLIDADALMKSFEAVLGAAPCELNGYEIWEILNAQEPIDAIPIEWLKGLMLSTEDDVDKAELAWILRELESERREQEAQGCQG